MILIAPVIHSDMPIHFYIDNCLLTPIEAINRLLQLPFDNWLTVYINAIYFSMCKMTFIIIIIGIRITVWGVSTGGMGTCPSGAWVHVPIVLGNYFSYVFIVLILVLVCFFVFFIVFL